MSRSQPPWLHTNIKRVKSTCIVLDNWRDRFIELRERYLKILRDNMKLRDSVKEIRAQSSKRGRRASYNSNYENESYFDEDWNQRVERFNRVGSIDTENW